MSFEINSPFLGQNLWDYTELTTPVNADLFRIEKNTPAGDTPYETQYITFQNLAAAVGGIGTGKTPPEANIPFVSTGTVLGDEEWNTQSNVLGMSYWGAQGSEPGSSLANRFYLFDDSGTTRLAVKKLSDSQQLVAYLSDIGGGSLLTTKGDLLGYDTTANRFPIGTNGQILTVDSTQPFGFKWGAAPSGTVPTPTGIGDILYSADGATFSLLPAGSNTEVLTLAAGVPSWAAPVTGVTTYVALTDTPGIVNARTLQVGNSGGTALVNNTSVNTIKEIFLQIQNPPVISAEGQIVYDGITDRFQGAVAGPTGKSFAFTDDFNGVTLTSSGGGTNFLADDGAYKAVAGGASPLTTKGDLYTYDTADARLPVGVTGTILRANSATSTGLEWVGGTKGDLLASDGTGFLNLSKGSDAQVLTVDNASGTFNLAWKDNVGLPTPLNQRQCLVSTGVTSSDYATNTSSNTIDALYLTVQSPALINNEGQISYDGISDRFVGVVAGATAKNIAFTDDISGGIISVPKTADESVTNSTTYQNDNHIQNISLDANATYTYKLSLICSQTVASVGIKTQLIYSGTPAATINSTSRLNTTTTSTIIGIGNLSNTPYEIINSANAMSDPTNGNWMYSTGTIVTGAGGGNLTLQWAQGASNANATELLTGSYIELIKVS